MDKTFKTKPKSSHQFSIKSKVAQEVSIGKDKLVSVRYQNNHPLINIRAYIRDQHGRMFSTKRGILLNATEWRQLKQNISKIDRLLKQRQLQLDGDITESPTPKNAPRK